MKIGLIGTGKMGSGIVRLAHEHSCEVVATINSTHQNFEEMEKADLWIDFSTAEKVLFHVEKAIHFKKNILIGTTNWESSLPKVRDQVLKSSIGVLALANCSMGLFIFLEALKKAALLLSKSHLSFSLQGLEIHHQHKKDAPSGTAKEIMNVLKKHPLSFESQRKGEEPGFHQVTFSTPYETITFSHLAKSREGFLKGAFEAAFWLQGKSGFYTLENYLEEVFCET